MHGMTAKTRNHGMTDAASRLEGALEDAWCMQSDARSSSSCSVTTVYVPPDVWARAMPAGDALPTEKMKWSTQDDVRQRRADVVDCCGERERSIREDSAVRRPTRQEVGDCWWEVFREGRLRAPPPQRRRSAHPRGTSMGQMGGATRSDDGDRQLGRSHRDKWPVMYHEEH